MVKVVEIVKVVEGVQMVKAVKRDGSVKKLIFQLIFDRSRFIILNPPQTAMNNIEIKERINGRGLRFALRTT